MSNHFKEKILLLIILNIIISGSILAFAQQQDQSRQEKQASEIYGVRWFLGDYFTFHLPQSPPANQEMFILMFNSEEQLDDEIFLLINGTRYGCYERFLEIESVGEHHQEYNKNASKEGQNFTNAMYKCIVYAQNFNGQAEVKYQIVSGWTIFEGKDNTTIVKKYKQFTLFEGILRIPQNMPKMSFFFLSDWGIISEKVQLQLGYKDVKPSMLKTLSENKNIGLLVFGGDIAYDFEGQMYKNMLKYLQPLTSQIATLATPGNHESVYHDDSLELFVQSFYSPMWYKYFNYFSLTAIDSHKLVILSYDPENYIFPWVNRLGKNLSEIFDAELNITITSYIKKNYDVVAFSHYPMHCSEVGQHYQTCEQNKIRFQPFMNKFRQMGIDFYLSGHLHIYERTKPMCNQTYFKSNNQNTYDKECPVFVVEGASGNDMWVEMVKRYEPKDFSGSIIYGTGYGLVTLDQRNLTYQHYKVQDKEVAAIADSILLYESSDSNNQKESNIQKNKKIENIQQRFIVILQVLALVVLGGLLFCLLYKIRKGRQTINTDRKSHTEMIEENFETPPNNNKDQSKEEPSIQ